MRSSSARRSPTTAAHLPFTIRSPRLWLLALALLLAAAVVATIPLVKKKRDSADNHLKLAMSLREAGRVEEAIDQYRQAIHIEPNNPMPHILLGNTFFQSGSIQSAIAQYQDAIRIAPDSFVAHFNLGNAFLKTGRTGDAIAQYQMVVRLKPDFAPARQKLAALSPSP